MSLQKVMKEVMTIEKMLKAESKTVEFKESLKIIERWGTGISRIINSCK